MPDKIQDPRLLEIAEANSDGPIRGLGEPPPTPIPLTPKYGEHLGNYTETLTDSLRSQLRATKPTVLLFLDNLLPHAVNEAMQLLWGEGVRVTLIFRPYYDPLGLGSAESIEAYITGTRDRLVDLIAQPLVKQAYDEGRLWVKLFNETNIGTEGFPKGRAGFAPALAAWQRGARALKGLFPALKVGSLANTPGNDDTFFKGDTLNAPYWYHGPEAAKENPTAAEVNAAKASAIFRPMFEEANGIFAHVYAPQTRMVSGDLQRWYARRHEEYLKFLPPGKPMFLCEGDVGYDDGPAARASGMVYWLQNILDGNPRVAGVCLWWNAAPGEGDPLWTKHFTRDVKGAFAPVVTAVAAYRAAQTVPPSPPGAPPRVVAFAGLPLTIETPPLTAGQKYWFARKVTVLDATHGGDGHIYVRTFRANQRVAGILVRIAWPDGGTLGTTQTNPLTDKGDYAFAMTLKGWDPATGPGPYGVSIASGKSEVIAGMGLPFDRPYSLLVEFEEYTVPDPDQDALLARLHTASDAAQVLKLNPKAALQKEIARRQFVPTSPEFSVEYKGKRYIGQRAESLITGAVAVAWVEVGVWDKVTWSVKK